MLFLTKNSLYLVESKIEELAVDADDSSSVEASKEVFDPTPEPFEV